MKTKVNKLRNSKYKKGNKKNYTRKNTTHSIENNKLSSNENYKKVKCGPNPNSNDFSCYSNNALFKMKNAWNVRHARDKILTNEPKKIDRLFFWQCLQCFFKCI